MYIVVLVCCLYAGRVESSRYRRPLPNLTSQAPACLVARCRVCVCVCVLALPAALPCLACVLARVYVQWAWHLNRTQASLPTKTPRPITYYMNCSRGPSRHPPAETNRGSAVETTSNPRWGNHTRPYHISISRRVSTAYCIVAAGCRVRHEHIPSANIRPCTRLWPSWLRSAPSG